METSDRLDRWRMRFAGITCLYGDKPESLIDRHVAVIGLGGVGSWAAEAHLLRHCRLRKKIIVTTGGAGGRIDPTQIKVADLNKTVQDRLS